MQAGLDVLADEGWERFTLARACERAGVSVGLLYRRFENREAFLEALQDRWLTRVEEQQAVMLEVPVDWLGGGLEGALRRAVDGVVGSARREERLLRVLGEHGTFDAAGLARLSRLTRRYGAWFRAGVLHHREAIAHDDPERAVDFVYRLVIDATVRRGNFGDEFDTGRSSGDWDAFAAELWSVGCAYLLRPQRV